MLKVDRNTYDLLVDRSREDDPFCLFSQGPDDGGRQMHEALCGRHDAIRDKMLRRLADGRDDDIDDLCAGLLAHHGIDPLAVAVLVAIMGDEGVYISHSDRPEEEICFLKSENNHRDGYVWLSDEVQWNLNGTVVMPPLPETMLAALPGRRLSEAVAHPVLDRFPHTVSTARIEDMQGTECTYIATPRRAHIRLAADGLAAHRPMRLDEAA